MDETTFRNTEIRYREIKEKLDRGELNPEQAKADLKRLMVQDADGHYWMLGGKSGNWYVHKDNQWTEADPFEMLFPKQEEPMEEEPALELSQFQAEQTAEPVADTSEPVVQSSEPAVETTGYSEENPFQDDESGQADDAFQVADEYRIDDSSPVGGTSEPAVSDWESQAPDEAATYQTMEAVSSSSGDQSAEPFTVESTNLTAEGNFQTANSFTTVDAYGGLDDDGKADPFDVPARTQKNGDPNEYSDYQISEQPRQRHDDFGGLHEDYEAGTGFNEISLAPDDGQPGHAAEVPPVVDTRKFAVVSDEQQNAGGHEPDKWGQTQQPSIQQEEQNLFRQEPIQYDQQTAFMPDAGTGSGVIDFQAEQPPAQQEELAVSHTPSAEKPALGDHLPCKACKSLIPPHAAYCSFCGANQEGLAKQRKVAQQPVSAAPAKAGKVVLEDGELLVKSIKITAFFFFLGGVGIFLGVIFGAVFGVISDMLPELHGFLPMMLQETRGQLTGGLIFAAAGGIGGFIAGAVLSLIVSGIYNMISSIFGGIRFKIKQ